MQTQGLNYSSTVPPRPVGFSAKVREISLEPCGKYIVLHRRYYFVSVAGSPCTLEEFRPAVVTEHTLLSLSLYLAFSIRATASLMLG
jgi:hypothetical protein